MNEKIPMKSKLSKITFLLMCIFILLFSFVKIYTVRMLGEQFDGWNHIIDMSLSLGSQSLVKILGENFVMPIISFIICLIYTIKIGRKQKINRFVYATTAVAILIEILFYMLSSYNKPPVFPLLHRIVLLLAFLLLFADSFKELPKKILYIAPVCSVAYTAVYLMIYYKNSISPVMQNAEGLQGLQLFCVYSQYFVLPALGFIISGLVWCYIFKIHPHTS